MSAATTAAMFAAIEANKKFKKALDENPISSSDADAFVTGLGIGAAIALIALIVSVLK